MNDNHKAPLPKIDLTRRQLYERVWSEPVSRFCRECGLSGVGLAKFCDEWDIPCPPRGYWAMKRSGQRVRHKKLKPIEQGDPVIFTYTPIPESERKGPQRVSDHRRAFEKRPENRITVPEELIDPHPLVVRTEQSLRRALADDKGMVRPKAKGCLDVVVSPALIDRAMRIMNTIITTLGARDLRVSVSDEEHRSTSVAILGELVSFWLYEKPVRKPRDSTPAERRDDEFWTWTGRPPRVRFAWVPSGNLMLQVCGHHPSWGDRSDRRLETFLNSFVVALVQAAERLQEGRVEAERKAKEREEQAKRRREDDQRRREEEQRHFEAETRRRIEEARVQQLAVQAADYARADQIRTFVDRVRTAALKVDGVIAEGSKLSRWLVWAEGAAALIDPCTDILVQHSQHPADYQAKSVDGSQSHSAADEEKRSVE